MKRVISLILTIILTLSCFTALPFNSFAEYYNDFEYELNDEEVTVTKYTGTDTDVTVPDEISGKPVTAIGESAFYLNESIVSVSIPETITSIGYKAFAGCTSLSKITLPVSLKTIGDSAFLSCCVEGMYIPKGVTYIGFDALNMTVRNIEVDENNSAYATLDGVLYNKDFTELIRLPSLYEGKFELPSTVKKIDMNSINNHNITNLVLNDGLEIIDEFAIRLYDNCLRVDVPKTVKTIKSFGIGNGYKKEKINVYLFSRDCEITGLDKSYLKLICYAESSGEAYAIKNNFEYEIMDCENNHSFKTQVFEPTCTEQGYTLYTCGCGYSYTDNIVSANGHNLITDKGYDATCTKDGLSDGTHCDVCNEVINPQTVIDALGHKFNSNILTKASCTESGEIEYVCQTCGYSYVETIPPNGHSFTKQVVAPTCTELGYTLNVCACGVSYKDDYAPATGHSFNKQIVAPTCTEKGYTVYTCDCGESYTDDYVDENGHTFSDEPTFALNPSCTEKGLEKYTCSVCGYSEDRELSALGHKYKAVCEKQATFDKDGYSVDVCLNCGNKINKRVVPAIKSVILSKSSLTYTGKALFEQAVRITDNNGKAISSDNYDVKYISRSNKKEYALPQEIGQYRAEITFKNNYSGKKNLYFSVMPKTPKLKPLKSKKKSVTVRWKKSRGVSGYQILISTNKSFTKNVSRINVKSKKKVRKIKKLKKGKRYYIKIRSYKKVTVDGRKAKMYSPYSKAKRIKCK